MDRINVPNLLDYPSTEEYIQALREAWIASDKMNPYKKLYLASKICRALNHERSERPMFDIVEEWIQDPQSFDTSIS